jgi:hypothetical protein
MTKISTYIPATRTIYLLVLLSSISRELGGGRKTDTCIAFRDIPTPYLSISMSLPFIFVSVDLERRQVYGDSPMGSVSIPLGSIISKFNQTVVVETMWNGKEDPLQTRNALSAKNQGCHRDRHGPF